MGKKSKRPPQPTAPVKRTGRAKDQHRAKRLSEKTEIERLEQLAHDTAPARGRNALELEEEDNSKPVKSQSSSSNGDDNDADTAADVDDNNNDASGDAQGDDQQQQQQGPAINAKFRKFADLPISRLTQNGLRDAKYERMTAIQAASIPHALVGRDVLAAAKTGSGKTLAFLIPILEMLFRAQWTPADGLGALVISPTRELALQIFDVLRKIGKYHVFSAGLVIGGKDVAEERTRISKMNILVCTPGRILQHMDTTVGFDVSGLKLLVLDEADRILDMGFERSVNAIIEHLPQDRQTLLFSATQTRSVSTLARLSLKEPEYVSVHEMAKFATPSKLIQHVLTCELPEKLDIIWSFIKAHLKSKCIFFFSSCKQVRLVYEAFYRLQPGVGVFHLHGKQRQMLRLATYKTFCERNHAVLFATDIAARGLDFPAVDWVIQVDCPEDVNTYIHRVGRTARYNAGGRGLLMLLPSEAKMIELLEERKIPLVPIKVNPQRAISMRSHLEALLSEDSQLKYLAQKAFISYMRSVYLNANKEVFDVHALPAKEFAASLGLPGAPKIKFALKNKANKNLSYEAQRVLAMAEKTDQPPEKKQHEQGMRYADKIRRRQPQGPFSEHYQKLQDDDEHSEDADSSDDDILTLKRRHGDSDDEDGDLAPLEYKKPEKRSKRRKALKEQLEQQQRTDVVFDDPSQIDIEAEQRKYSEKVVKSLEQEDSVDKELLRERLREKRRRRKELARGESGASSVVIAPYNGEEIQYSDADEDDDEDEDRSDDADDDDDDEEEEDTRRPKGLSDAAARRQRELALESDEDDEDDEEEDDDDEDEEEAEEEAPVKHKHKVLGKHKREAEAPPSQPAKRHKPMTLEEQEELALRMLQNKHR